MKDTSETKNEIDDLLQSYLPDKYYENQRRRLVPLVLKFVREYSSIQVNEAKKEHLAHLKEIEEAVQRAYVETGLRVAAILIENKNLKEEIESLNTKP